MTDEKKWTPENMAELMKTLREQQEASPLGRATEALHKLLGMPRHVAERAAVQALQLAEAEENRRAIVDYERAMKECIALRKAAEKTLNTIHAQQSMSTDVLASVRDPDGLKAAITATAFLTELDDS